MNTQSQIPAKLISLRDHSLAVEVAAYIRVNAYDGVELVETKPLSRHFGVSAKSLHTLFTSKYGMTVHAFAMQVRHQIICERLLAGESIKKIRIEAGYTEKSNFSRDFKRMEGISPKQYIDQQKQHIHHPISTPMLMTETS